MNVLQVTVGNRSYPPDTGGYQRTHGLTCSFPNYGDTVTRYCCTGPLATYYREGEFLDSRLELRPDLVEERHYSLLHDIPKIPTVFGYPGFPWKVIFKTWAGGKIKSEVAQYDVAIADNPYLALFLADQTRTPTVYSSHNIEHQQYRSTADVWGANFFATQLQKVEEEAVRKSDLVVCTTESDQNQFQQYSRPTTVIPNGISKKKIDNDPDPEERSMFGIPDDAMLATFLGSDYKPNNEAAAWLANNWSELDDGYHLIVIGDSGQGIDDTSTNVHTAGYVEELDATLAMADLALNPIFSGGGSNVKLIEYFAAELPVVSTAFGARGFTVEDGQHLLLSEKNEFLNDVMKLGENKELRNGLAVNGHKLAATQYTWESLSEVLKEELHRLVQ